MKLSGIKKTLQKKRRRKEIFNEKIYKQPDLKGLNRLSIMTKEEDAFYFYYFDKDKQAINYFVKTLKKLKYAVETNKTNLNY